MLLKFSSDRTICPQCPDLSQACIHSKCLDFLPGSIAYDSVRSLSYADADVFLVCFSVSDPNSLHNVRTKWNAEIRRHRPDAPVVLCGTAADLR